MKHHIDNAVLKTLKRNLWELRSREITIQMKMDKSLVFSQECLLLNYGCIQYDKHGHEISSNDSSYNYHYRREAEADPNKYYKLFLDFKGLPQKVIDINPKEISFSREIDRSEILLTWSDGKHNYELIFRPREKILRPIKENQLTNSRYFSLTRKIRIKDKGQSKVRRDFDKDGNEIANNLQAIERRRRRKEEREKRKAEQGPVKPVAFPGKNGQKNFEKWKAEQERKKEENNKKDK